MENKEELAKGVKDIKENANKIKESTINLLACIDTLEVLLSDKPEEEFIKKIKEYIKCLGENVKVKVEEEND